jgi:hypothetical protein
VTNNTYSLIHVKGSGWVGREKLILTTSLYEELGESESNAHKFFDADPGWKNFGSGMYIPDPQHW